MSMFARSAERERERDESFRLKNIRNHFSIILEYEITFIFAIAFNMLNSNVERKKIVE